MKKNALIALADRIEAKYPGITETPISKINDPSIPNLFTLINKTSHLAEKIAAETMRLSDRLTDYEMNSDSFPKDKLIQMHIELGNILRTVQSLSS